MANPRVRKNSDDGDMSSSDAPQPSKKPRRAAPLTKSTSTASASTSGAASSSQASAQHAAQPAASSSRGGARARGGQKSSSCPAGKKGPAAGKKKAIPAPELENDGLEFVTPNVPCQCDEEDTGDVEAEEDPEAQLGEPAPAFVAV